MEAVQTHKNGRANFGPVADEKVNFEAAVMEYSEAAIRWEKAATALRDVQSRLREFRREMEYREAELRLDPAVGEGKNEAARAAILTGLVAADAMCRECVRMIDALQVDVQQLQDEIAAASNRMSVAKKIMDFSTAYVRFLAGGE